MVDEAKVVGVNLPISWKKSVEVCNFIRYKDIKKVRNLLTKVIEKKVAIPYKRYKRETPHRKGKIGAGRFPVKAAIYFLRLVNTVEANAENKGLNVDDLYITYAVANKGEKQWHFGRHRRRLMKRTHLELRAAEREKK